MQSRNKRNCKPNPEQVESIQRTSLDFLEQIIRCGQEKVVGDEFMNLLRELVINPVRKDLR